MKKRKLTEIVVLAIIMFLSLHFVILPGLESDNFLINIISLTSFFFIVAVALFGGIFSGINDSSEE